MIWWIVLMVLVALVYKVARLQNHWKERDVPFEESWPVFGELAPLIFRRETLAQHLTRIYAQIGDKRYSGIYQLVTPMLFLKDPDLIKEVAVKNSDCFPDHRDFLSTDVDTVFGGTLMALRGEKWHMMRSLLSPAFTSSKMKFMFGLISECADQFVQFLSDKYDSSTSWEMKDLFSRFTNDVIANAVFGVHCNSLTDRDNLFYRMVEESSQFSGVRAFKFFLTSTSPGLTKLLRVKLFPDELEQFFRNLVQDSMRMREENNITRPDMIHLMMEAKKGKLRNEEGTSENFEKFKLTDDHIVSQATVFILAGFETSATALCYTAHELAVNQDVQRKLQAEIDETLRNSKGKLTYEALVGMKYLDMVISEALRKYPPFAMTDRKCGKDTYVIEPKQPGEKPLKLVNGDIVLLPIYALQMDPKYFPNPEKFDPERFSAENKGNIKQGTYMPFGIGPRNCIGSRFALMESKAVLFHLLSKFDIVTTEKTQVPIKQAKSNMNMGAEKGFWLGFRKRGAI